MSPTAKKRNRTATTKKKKPTSSAKKGKTAATTNKKPTLTVTPQATTPQLSSPIPSLPYDLLLNCLARISRLYYPTLSLVSKSFRSLLVSHDLYKARSLFGRRESCLYVCIGSFSGSRWFTLCRKPDGLLTSDTSKKKTSSGYVLATVPSPHNPKKQDLFFQGLVVVGSNIYSIDPRRFLPDDLSPTPVSILDCWSHTWHKAPCLRVKLMNFSASVLDRKIYVAGCYKDDGDSNSYKNLMEVFDTVTQTWDPKPIIPYSETFDGFHYRTVCVDGKIHVVRDFEVVAYNSKEGRWDRVEKQIGRYTDSDSHCEIHNVLYSVLHGKIIWYDTEVSKWREVKGLVGLPKFAFDKKGIRLADYGGKMAVLWHEEWSDWPYGNYYYLGEKIWCAEITLEKRKCGEIWGKVEWFDHVLTVPSLPPRGILKALAATV